VIFKAQLFRCPNCLDEIVARTPTDCDQIEGSACGNCDFGMYMWITPVTDELDEDTQYELEKESKLLYP
jgi:hypothetical protein